MTLDLGWWSTGKDALARNLLTTTMKKKNEEMLDVKVAFVFSNWEEDEEPEHPDFNERQKFFELVHSYDIPLLALSWKRFRASMKGGTKEEWRAIYGKKMRSMIYGHHFDLGVLAGFSLRMDGDTCTRFDMINLHPALPEGPKGTWQENIYRIICTRAETHGALMRLCTPDEDEGPVLTYCGFALNTPEYRRLWIDFDENLGKRSLDLLSKEEIEQTKLFKKIRLDSERREIPLVTYTIKLFADSDVGIINRKLVTDGRPLSSPYDLTPTVDLAISRGEF